MNKYFFGSVFAVLFSLLSVEYFYVPAYPTAVNLILNKTKLPNPNIYPSNKINGEVPPMKPTLAAKQDLIVKENVGNGWTLITNRTYRAKGTRAPIHIHPYGGQTCVVVGEMTLYMDGAEPARKISGDCYYMPPGRRMSGVNSGDNDAIMFDTFSVPEGEDTWQIVEPGFESMTDFSTHNH